MYQAIVTLLFASSLYIVAADQSSGEQALAIICSADQETKNGIIECSKMFPEEYQKILQECWTTNVEDSEYDPAKMLDITCEDGEPIEKMSLCSFESIQEQKIELKKLREGTDCIQKIFEGKFDEQNWK